MLLANLGVLYIELFWLKYNPVVKSNFLLLVYRLQNNCYCYIFADSMRSPIPAREFRRAPGSEGTLPSLISQENINIDVN